MAVVRADDARDEVVVRLERAALWARYLAYAVLAGLFLAWGGRDGSYRDLIIVTVVVGVHNAFVHAVLWTRRYRWFRTTLNFLVYLTETSLIVLFTGADESDLFVLYLLLIIGFSAYSQSYSVQVFVTLACVAAYALVLVVEWRLIGVAEKNIVLIARFASICLCGWLVATVSTVLVQLDATLWSRVRALASSEATMRTLIEGTSGPIFVYNREGVIIEVNKRACRLLGLQREQFIGRKLSSLMERDDAPEAYRAGQGEHVFLDATGRNRILEYDIRPFVRDDQPAFAMVTRDVTEDREIEAAARAASMSLARQNRDLQKAVDLRTDLVRATTLRLRSPLTAIIGYMDAMLSEEAGELTPEQRDTLKSCRNGALHIFRLVDEAAEAVEAASEIRPDDEPLPADAPADATPLE